MGIQNFDHSHHKLKIRGQQSPVDVLTFEGREQLSTPFRYDIQFTSTDKAITPELVLMQDGAFSLTAPPVSGRWLLQFAGCFLSRSTFGLMPGISAGKR